MIEGILWVLAVLAVIFAPVALLARALNNPCEGKPHDWARHPDYFRSRLCMRCARRETLARGWEFDGYDRAAIAAATGEQR